MQIQLRNISRREITLRTTIISGESVRERDCGSGLIKQFATLILLEVNSICKLMTFCLLYDLLKTQNDYHLICISPSDDGHSVCQNEALRGI